MDTWNRAFGELTAALSRLGVRYFVGGSLASSVRGVFRATADIDLVADLGAVPSRLAAELGPDWYVDSDSIVDAVRHGRAFNCIYIPSADKFDIFPVVEPFHESELERATETDLSPFGLSVRCPVATAEDILLAKLAWFRAGGEVSERQWSDITLLIAVNPALDRDYLHSWAPRLGVAGLLLRAIESSTPE